MAACAEIRFIKARGNQIHKAGLILLNLAAPSTHQACLNLSGNKMGYKSILMLVENKANEASASAIQRKR